MKAAAALVVIAVGAVFLTRAIAARRVDTPMLPNPAVDAKPAAVTSDTAVLAGGCFWGVSEVFKHVKGVSSVVSGYAGGQLNAPTYGIVSSGMTGHAESVQIAYDPSKVSYGTLLKVFFAVAHDPTTLNRQGPDHGTQYRSAIFFRSPDLKKRGVWCSSWGWPMCGGPGGAPPGSWAPGFVGWVGVVLRFFLLIFYFPFPLRVFFFLGGE